MYRDQKLEDRLSLFMQQISQLAELERSDSIPILKIDESPQPKKVLALVEAGLDINMLQEIFGNQPNLLKECLLSLAKAGFDISELGRSVFTENELNELNKSKKNQNSMIPLKNDILGEYYPAENKIVLYLKPCLFTAYNLRIHVDDLLQVVLAHEAAHAVTHRDLDKKEWWWKNFNLASNEDKELFAQIYPYKLFDNNLDKELKTTFLKLATIQSGVYKGWESYQHKSLEIINQALWVARRKQPKIEEKLPKYIEDIHKKIDDYENQSTHGQVEIEGVVLPGCYPVCPGQPPGAPSTAPGIINEIFLDQEPNCNCIPSNITGTCYKTLVVAIASEDDVEKRILEAIEHIYSHCAGINEYVLFVAHKWDEYIWRKHKAAFSGVGVGLRLLSRGRYELIDWNDKGSYPWDWRQYNRGIIKNLMKELNHSFSPYITKNSILENGFKIYQGQNDIAACTFINVQNVEIQGKYFNGNFHVECWTDRNTIRIVWNLLKGDESRFKAAIENLLKHCGISGSWSQKQFRSIYRVERLENVQQCAIELFSYTIKLFERKL